VDLRRRGDPQADLAGQLAGSAPAGKLAGTHATKAQESTDRAFVPWPGWRSLKGTDSRGEQGFEAGVPAAVSGEPGRSETRALQYERGNPSRAVS
jgi:hypothetical protein